MSLLPSISDVTNVDHDQQLIPQDIGSTLDTENSDTTAMTFFWDWHSYIILGLLLVMIYHVWSFRSMYLGFICFVRRAVERREFEGMNIEVTLTMNSPRDFETHSVQLASTPDRGYGMNPVNVITIEQPGDHYHDCCEE